jgi:hypothetical protein
MTDSTQRIATDNPTEFATRGHFSENYYDGMRKALESAADLTEHVVSMITVATRGDDEVSGTKEPPLPFNTTAFNDANNLYATLVYFARLWADRLTCRPRRRRRVRGRTARDASSACRPTCSRTRRGTPRRSWRHG